MNNNAFASAPWLNRNPTLSHGQRIANQGTAQSLATLADMQNRMNQRGGANGSGGGAGQSRVMDAHNRAFDLAELDRFRQMRDPADAFVMENLRDVATGANTPFNAETINNLRSVASDNTSAATAQQLRSLQGRPGDPGYESAKREIMARGQGRTQASDRDINTQARLSNFDATQDALSRIFGFNADRQRRITDADRFLIDLLRSQRASEDTGV